MSLQFSDQVTATLTVMSCEPAWIGTGAAAAAMLRRHPVVERHRLGVGRLRNARHGTQRATGRLGVGLGLGQRVGEGCLPCTRDQRVVLVDVESRPTDLQCVAADLRRVGNDRSRLAQVAQNDRQVLADLVAGEPLRCCWRRCSSAGLTDPEVCRSAAATPSDFSFCWTAAMTVLASCIAAVTVGLVTLIGA